MHWINLSASATLSSGAVTRFVAIFGVVLHEHWEGGDGGLDDCPLRSSKREDCWGVVGVVLGGLQDPQFFLNLSTWRGAWWCTMSLERCKAAWVDINLAQVHIRL